MTKTVIHNDNSLYSGNGDTLDLTGPGTLIVAADGFIIEGGTAYAVDLSGAPWTVKVDGTISSTDYALELSSNTGHSSVTVGKQGFIEGAAAGISADHPTDITNAGTILGGPGYAVDEDISGNFKIVNSGVIEDDQSDAIVLGANGVHTIVNSGKIIASFSGDAIVTAGDSVEHVTNSGYIYFNVALGGGDDTFKNVGKGWVVGNIDLGEGNDVFTGGNHQDVVHDAGGKDHYNLGGGNDVFVASGPGSADGGTDSVNGGNGSDEYNFNADTAGMIVNLDTKQHGEVDFPNFYHDNFEANSANGSVTGFDKVFNFEDATGGSGSDTIFGSAQANTLQGFDGFDELYGFAGNDQLDGGASNDFLVGGKGVDTLTGGTGADTFYFAKLSDSGTTAGTRDTITDFEGAGAAGGDFIDLSAIDANAHHTGNDAFTLLTDPNSKFTHTAGELRYFWQGDNTIVQADVNGDAKADFSIALNGHLTFIASDFVL